MQLRNHPVNSKVESDGNSEEKGSTDNRNNKGTEEEDQDDVPEIDLVLKCKTCTKTFTKYLKLKKHTLRSQRKKLVISVGKKLSEIIT